MRYCGSAEATGWDSLNMRHAITPEISQDHSEAVSNQATLLNRNRLRLFREIHSRRVNVTTPRKIVLKAHENNVTASHAAAH
jgi:hypothetical protein